MTIYFPLLHKEGNFLQQLESRDLKYGLDFRNANFAAVFKHDKTVDCEKYSLDIPIMHGENN